MIALREAIPSDFIDRIEAVFSSQGALAKAKNFEKRPQQQQMAVAIARVLEREQHLVAEVGTGVGKSLGYLVPAILFALEQHKKAIISTHTINLQEQLLHKDIPILKKILPVEFDACLMKGRQNYLCPRRLQRTLAQRTDLFTGPEQNELERLAEWATHTSDGTLSDLGFEPDPKVWAQVCSEPHVCSRKLCADQPNCFYQRARQRVLSADLVVMNHTLLFMLLSSAEDSDAEEEGGYIFANDFLILDEAHTIEQTASRQIGIGVSQYGLRATVQRLYNPRTHKGLFTVTRDGTGVTLAAELIDQIDEFFRAIESRADFSKGREYRVRQPDFIPDTITRRLLNLQSRLTEVMRRQSDELLKVELQELGRRLAEARGGIEVFLNQSAPEHVYWIEKTGKAAQFLTLNAAPADMAPVLRRLLFRDQRSCIMTSATLSVGRTDLAYFRNRVGAEKCEPLQLGSPFRFERQMKIFLVRKMPDPRETDYQSALARWIEHFVIQTEGHAFVLFTNYRAMQQLAGHMADFFAERGLPLLVQGGGLPRSKMLQRFKSTPGSVLFGTDSFWMGVDVPGDALRNVIITRLPFAVPDHPLIQARLEMIIARGGDAFTEYSLPEAILKLRQGVGRLIRSKTDQGIVVILDNRIVTKPYGRAFMTALPECPVEIV